jgi:hypothetical protein
VTDVHRSKGISASLEEFRPTTYVQTDLHVGHPIKVGNNWTIIPLAEFFNLFSRKNPGVNDVTNVASLPAPSDQAFTWIDQIVK